MQLNVRISSPGDGDKMIPPRPKAEGDLGVSSNSPHQLALIHPAPISLHHGGYGSRIRFLALWLWVCVKTSRDRPLRVSIMVPA
jgi:hypothetical protein